MNSRTAAIDVEGVAHRYQGREALAGVSLVVEPGETFAVLGPNGSGKTTLFRLLATLIPLAQGTIRVFGRDVAREADDVRGQIGVVFQAPSLDKKLTVSENLRHQGHLYGLTGRDLASREDEMLARLGIADRARERVETLSGGLRRRVDLAKGMLHRPRLLLMDEPSQGLDPAARSDLWQYLRSIARDEGVTIFLTTHLLEEADRADRIAIFNRGSVVALDTPDNLRRTIGGDTITIETDDPAALAAAIEERFAVGAAVVDGRVHLELPQGHEWIARLVSALPDRIRAITLAKPSLEDVFIARTGHRFFSRAEKTNGD